MGVDGDDAGSVGDGYLDDGEADSAGADDHDGLPGHPASPGTHIEIGWASALGKPIILLLEEGKDYAFLVRDLHTVADVTYLTTGDTESLPTEVIDAVNRLAQHSLQTCTGI